MFHYTELDCFNSPSLLSYFKVAKEPSHVVLKDHFDIKILNPQLSPLYFKLADDKPLSDVDVKTLISNHFLRFVFGKEEGLLNSSSVFLDSKTYSAADLFSVAAKERFRMSAYQNEPDILWVVPPPIFNYVQENRDAELLSQAVIYRYHSREWVLFGNRVVPDYHLAYNSVEMYAFHGVLSRAFKITIGDYILKNDQHYVLLYRFDVIDENALRIFKFNWVEPDRPVYELQTE